MMVFVMILLGLLVLIFLIMMWFMYAEGAARMIRRIDKVFPALSREICRDLVKESRSKRYSLYRRLTSTLILRTLKEIS